jgi:lipoate-protein ligase A
VRRSSGGGTVLLGAGCLLYSLILSYERTPLLRTVNSSNRYILNRIGQALSDAHPGIEFAGTSDLAIGGRKFSGNAQQRKQRHLLHHGTLLYDFDLALVGRYVRLPKRQPSYRHGRNHVDFLLNLSVSVSDLKAALRHSFGAQEPLTASPRDLVNQLTAEKYSGPEWINRR